MNEHKPPTRTVQATETTFAIIETLSKFDGMRLIELSQELGLAKSTLHRYLQTLHYQGYLIKDGNEYHVSLRFLKIGETARNRKPAYQLVQTKVDELANETGEQVSFLVEENGRGVYLYRQAGNNAVNTYPGIGSQEYLHATSAGKAILASWEDEKLMNWLKNRDLPRFTENTITDPKSLKDELDAIRERGFSLNKQEAIDGLRAVSVAISDGAGGTLGALSVSGPRNRLQGERFEQELPNLLLGYTNELELNIQFE